MSEFEPDPSASTGRFQAFADRAEEELPRRNPAFAPAVLIAVGVAVIVIVVLILAL